MDIEIQVRGMNEWYYQLIVFCLLSWINIDSIEYDLVLPVLIT